MSPEFSNKLSPDEEANILLLQARNLREFADEDVAIARQELVVGGIAGVTVLEASQIMQGFQHWRAGRKQNKAARLRAQAQDNA